MTLLDAYAVVAFLIDEPASEEVEAILDAGGARVVVVNLAEAVDVTQRVHDLARDDVRAAVEPLLLSNVLASAISEEAHGWLAASIRTTYYDKQTAAVSTADCFLLAHAAADGGPIATADPSVASIARDMNIDVTALPDSAGARPNTA